MTRLRTATTLAPAVLFLLAAGSAAAESGRLDRIRDEAPGTRPDREDRDRDRPRRDDRDDDDDQTFGEALLGSLLGEIFGKAFWEGLAAIVGFPFWGPRKAMGDADWEQGFFPSYPYLDGQRSMRVNDTWDDEVSDDELRTVAFRAGFSFGRDDDIDIWRGDFLVRESGRLGLKLGYTQLVEDLGGGVDDRLSLATVIPVVRFAQHENAQMRAGMGMVAMPGEDEQGLVFTYEGDFFPGKPLVISAGIDFGELGDAGYSHLRLSLGLLYRNMELAVGYDSLRIGTVTIDGPTVGVRVW